MYIGRRWTPFRFLHDSILSLICIFTVFRINDMDDDEAASYYCISQSRCSLCRFTLQEGELIFICLCFLTLHDGGKDLTIS